MHQAPHVQHVSLLRLPGSDINGKTIHFRESTFFAPRNPARNESENELSRPQSRSIMWVDGFAIRKVHLLPSSLSEEFVMRQVRYLISSLCSGFESTSASIPICLHFSFAERIVRSRGEPSRAPSRPRLRDARLTRFG